MLSTIYYSSADQMCQVFQDSNVGLLCFAAGHGIIV